jgi:hypothetical protein
MARKRRGLKDNAAAYTPRSKQVGPDPHPSAVRKGNKATVDTDRFKGLADKVKQAAALRKNAKGIVAAPPSSPGGLKLRDAVKGRKPRYGVNKDRRLTYEEAIARRSTDSSRARAAKKYGRTYKPEDLRNTTPNAAPGAKPPTATVNFPKKRKKSYIGRRFDSRG